jgi:hypothetical protein
MMFYLFCKLKCLKQIPVNMEKAFVEQIRSLFLLESDLKIDHESAF